MVLSDGMVHFSEDREKINKSTKTILWALNNASKNTL